MMKFGYRAESMTFTDDLLWSGESLLEEARLSLGLAVSSERVDA